MFFECGVYLMWVGSETVIAVTQGVYPAPSRAVVFRVAYHDGRFMNLGIVGVDGCLEVIFGEFQLETLAAGVLPRLEDVNAFHGVVRPDFFAYFGYQGAGGLMREISGRVGYLKYRLN